MKRCCGCKEVKPMEEFWKNVSAHDGRQRLCRPCKSAYQRQWRQNNPDKVALIARNDRQRHLERHRAQESKWRTPSKPETKRMNQQRRRARLRSVEMEKFTFDEIFLRDQGLCGICSEPVERVKASLDHVVPISKGGPHTRSNVQIAHLSCNCRKGAQLTQEVSL